MEYAGNSRKMEYVGKSRNRNVNGIRRANRLCFLWGVKLRTRVRGVKGPIHLKGPIHSQLKCAV